MVAENQTKKSLFQVHNVWYLNGPQSHVTYPFEYRTHILSSIQMVTVCTCFSMFVSWQFCMFFLWSAVLLFLTTGWAGITISGLRKISASPSTCKEKKIRFKDKYREDLFNRYIWIMDFLISSIQMRPDVSYWNWIPKVFVFIQMPSECQTSPIFRLANIQLETIYVTSFSNISYCINCE